MATEKNNQTVAEKPSTKTATKGSKKPETKKPETKKPAPVAEKKTEKQKTPKVSLKDIATKVEADFKKSQTLDVIADTNLETPTAISYADYKFVHFYNKGTTKDLFQLYLGARVSTFIIRTKAAQFLGKDVEATPAEKKVNGEKKVIHVLVKCPTENVTDVANKIVEAYGKLAQTVTAKEEKKPAKKEA